MKIERLNWIAFGNLKNASLDLSAGSQGLHLIYGDNEAGKSTSLRALSALLFGIPVRSTDNFRFPSSEMRLEGQLRLNSGTCLKFRRRKGNKDTLLAADEKTVLADTALSPFLLGVDKDVFTQLYAFDHLGLLEGGRALLEQQGDLGQALFSAALGGASLWKLTKQLKDKASELYVERASKPRLNQALARFKNAQQGRKNSSTSASAWKQQQKELELAGEQWKQVEEQVKVAIAEKSRLERLKRVLPPLTQRRKLLEELGNLGPLPAAPDFSQQCRAVVEQRRSVGEERRQLLSELELLRGQQGKLQLDPSLLEWGEKLEVLHGQRVLVAQDREQYVLYTRELQELSAQIDKLRACIQPGLGQAEPLRPLLLRRVEVQRLSKEHGILDERDMAWNNAFFQRELDRNKLCKQLENMPVAREGTALEFAVERAQQGGELAQRLDKASANCQLQQQELEVEFTRLGRYGGELAALFQAKFPLPATIDEFEKRLDQASAAQRVLEQDWQKNQNEREQISLKLSQSQVKALPSWEHLKQLRQSRDQGWRQLRLHFFAQLPLQESLPCSLAELPNWYEQMVSSCDEVADQLCLSADQVAQREQLQKQLELLDMQGEQLRQSQEQLSQRTQQAQLEWQQLWSVWQVEAASPSAMRQWLDRVERLAERRKKLAQESSQQAQLQRDYQQLLQPLREELFILGLSTEGSFAQLLQRGKQWLKEQEDVRQLALRLQEKLAELEQQEKRHQQEGEVLKRQRREWGQQWEQVCAGLDPLPSPATALEVWGALEGLFQKLDQCARLQREQGQRMEKMQQFAQKLAPCLTALRVADVLQEEPALSTMQLSQDTADHADNILAELPDAEAQLLSLYQRLQNMRAVQAKLQQLQQQMSKINQDISLREGKLENCSAQLQQLWEQARIAGCIAAVTAAPQSSSSSDGLRSELEGILLELAQQLEIKYELEKKLDRIKEELLRSGDGQSLEQLEQQASVESPDHLEENPDILEVKLHENRQKLEELQKERDEQRDNYRGLVEQLNQEDGRATAANFATEEQHSLADIKSIAEDYLRLELARLLLQQQVERYRQIHQAPLLRRASEFFTRLTCQRYSGLRDELDDKGTPYLLAKRAEGGQEVEVGAMSDGTRDQLHLALRLATLEAQCVHSEPLPLVMDDILVGFDDQRSQAALEVLAEIAGTTQVLLFTHHQRLVGLAQEVKAPAGVFCHVLSSEI